MKLSYYIFIYLLVQGAFLSAQKVVKGKVSESSSGNQEIPMNGANVYWLNSPIGTITNEKGEFVIPYDPEFKQLVISFIGFKTDTLNVSEPKTISHRLEATNQLDEVVVEKKRDPVQKSLLFCPERRYRKQCRIA